MPTSQLKFETLANLIGNASMRDVACPLCGPQCKTAQNAKRETLRLWCDDGLKIGFNCARCNAHGSVRGRERINVRSTTETKQRSRSDRSKMAREMWNRSLPLGGSLAAAYLKVRRCFLASPNIRFLPAHGQHPPTMISRFASDNGETYGVHMTRLRRDGLGKAEIQKPKIMVGPSAGWPIIIRDIPDHRVLFLAEGIEDACTLALACPDASAWAAGSAGRISTSLKRAKGFAKVFVAFDADAAGQKAMAEALRVRRDLIPVDVTRAMDSEIQLDANKVLMTNGLETVKACIDWCERAAMKEAA